MADAVSTADLEHLWDPAAQPLFTIKPPEWIATYLPRYCQSAADRTDSDCRGLALMVRELQREEFWRQLFSDWETCCQALFNRPAVWVEQVVEGVRVLHAQGHTEAVPLQLAIDQARSQPLAEHRRPTAEEREVKGSDRTFMPRGETQAYLLRRIARDQPELLDDIGPDKPHRSVRAAAIAAGIIKPVPIVRLVDDPAKIAASIKKHLSPEQITALVEVLLA
jgi:hypothetical protein